MSSAAARRRPLAIARATFLRPRATFQDTRGFCCLWCCGERLVQGPMWHRWIISLRLRRPPLSPYSPPSCPRLHSPGGCAYLVHGLDVAALGHERLDHSQMAFLRSPVEGRGAILKGDERRGTDNAPCETGTHTHTRGRERWASGHGGGGCLHAEVERA